MSKTNSRREVKQANGRGAKEKHVFERGAGNAECGKGEGEKGGTSNIEHPTTNIQ